MEAIQPLLKKREAARMLNLSVRTLENLLAAKQIASVRIRKSVRLNAGDVQAFISANREEATR